MHQLPLTRSHDPLPSYEAEERHTKSGVRAQNKRITLDAVLKHGDGFTSNELWDLDNRLSRHEYARRLPDLRDNDHAVYNPKKDGIKTKRRCTVGKGSAIMWRVERRRAVRVGNEKY